jgi:hypothetical protein
MALKSGMLDIGAAIECYKKYMAFLDNRVPTADEYERNLGAKMRDPNFCNDIYPFLAQGVEYDINEAYKMVKERVVKFM